MGDKGSPCLSPLLWKILFPDSPLIRKEDEEVAHNAEI
jgi:hypothetical protein